MPARTYSSVPRRHTRMGVSRKPGRPASRRRRSRSRGRSRNASARDTTRPWPRDPRRSSGLPRYGSTRRAPQAWRQIARVFRIRVGQQLGLRRQGEVGQDHLDVERREARRGRPCAAPSTRFSQCRSATPSQLNSASARPKICGERAPFPLARGARAARARYRSTSPPSARPVSPKKRRSGRKPNAPRRRPSCSAALVEQPPERALGREQQPLPEQRARLVVRAAPRRVTRRPKLCESPSTALAARSPQLGGLGSRIFAKMPGGDNLAHAALLVQEARRAHAVAAEVDA